MAKKRSTSKSITMLEFKAWIRGIEEMEGDDWYPSPEQWKKIKAKIELVAADEEEPELSSATLGPAYAGWQQPVQPYQPAPPQPSWGQAPNYSLDQLGSTKTPNIDTSSGGYQSPLG